jgi:hypothetical protein
MAVKKKAQKAKTGSKKAASAKKPALKARPAAKPRRPAKELEKYEQAGAPWWKRMPLPKPKAG